MLLGEQSLHPDPQLNILYTSLFTLNHLTATSQNQATAHFFFFFLEIPPLRLGHEELGSSSI